MFASKAGSSSIRACATVALAAAMLVGAAGGALAHRGASGVVKQRMDAMTEMKEAAKPLAQMMRGQRAYDEQHVRSEAARIRAHAGESMLRLFPEGRVEHPSQARPEIWTDWPQFQALANRLESLAGALEAGAATLSPTGAEAVYRKLTETCTDCHRRFRLKK